MSAPTRRSRERTAKLLRGAQYLLLSAGLLALGCYVLVHFESRVYQAYQMWRFDQIRQRRPATLARFVAHWIPGLAPPESAEAPASPPSEPLANRAPTAPGSAVSPGSLIGTIEIPRLNLSIAVLEGVDARTLRRAAGHVPGTALPGDAGNVEIAGHRDTFFRDLRKIQRNDIIRLSTVNGDYQYRVDSIAVVGTRNTKILSAFNGPGVNLVTCFPFYYVGPAPKRFVVHADQIAKIETVNN